MSTDLPTQLPATTPPLSSEKIVAAAESTSTPVTSTKDALQMPVATAQSAELPSTAVSPVPVKESKNVSAAPVLEETKSTPPSPIRPQGTPMASPRPPSQAVKKKASLLARLIHFPKGTKKFLYTWVWHILTFTLLLAIYFIHLFSHKVLSFRFIPKVFASILLKPVDAIYLFVSRKDTFAERTINRVNLIDLALRNMMFKKSRAVITVGGMAIGIGAIVFLVSIGFGLQQLVINRVARLDELLQTDVSSQPGSKERINDQTLSSFQQITNVSKVLPLIASVARVNFQNSVSDMAVYGVTSDYLEQSAVKPVEGKIFNSNAIAIDRTQDEDRGKVAGISDEPSGPAEFGAKIASINFSIPEGEWVRVRKEPSTKGAILGYTRRTELSQEGATVWGDVYGEAPQSSIASTSAGNKITPWVESVFPLWEKTFCDINDPYCIDGEYMLMSRTEMDQLEEKGYVAPIFIEVEGGQVGSVLGESIDGLVLAEETTATSEEATGVNSDASASAIFSSDPDSPWVDIASESASTTQEKITKIDLAASAIKQAVVNTAMLQLMGIEPNQAVGKKFSTSFVVVGDLLEENAPSVESNPSEYEIVGVVVDDKTPYFYVPFVDIRSLGVTNYSQVKVVAKDKNLLSPVRKQIEAMGYSTRSVADTVKQIDSLFAAVRVILTVLGMVALAVAALGMFNTLTVSLLERTREVGLMKAMGMKSHEVQELFLTESMVMGVFGGILGILLGFFAGKAIGLVLSIFSLSKGAGFIDISYLPPSYVLFIFGVSLLVGICTGIYPARRATKISALNALRYE